MRKVLKNSIAEKVSAHYDRYSETAPFGSYIKKGYYKELCILLKHLISPGLEVLDLGCGNGDILASLKPAYGVGIDISPGMIKKAKEKYVKDDRFEFILGDVCDTEVFKKLKKTFDVICISGAIQELEDVQKMLGNIRYCCTSKTRVVIVQFNRGWQIFLKLAEFIKVKKPQPVENWIPPEILRNLLHFNDFEIVREVSHLIFPIYLGPVSRVINRYFGHLPFVGAFSLLRATVARPIGKDIGQENRVSKPSLTVVIPCRNEAGNISELHKRMPKLPEGSEVIWVEGNSTDNTEALLRELVEKNQDKPYRFLKQPGKGKGDAVRFAFSMAKGDILLILDADMTVPPEEIPKFVDILVRDKAEFVNGTRLVYPMDEKAMRFMNLLGNKFFALLFRWLLGQPVTDTLCGTKAMWRSDYEEMLKRRKLNGLVDDPFGDFDLLFGAARKHLKIIDLPIRYGKRTYGETNISRFKDGLRLLRLVAEAASEVHFI